MQSEGHVQQGIRILMERIYDTHRRCHTIDSTIKIYTQIRKRKKEDRSARGEMIGTN